MLDRARQYLWAHSRANYSNSKTRKQKQNIGQCTAHEMIAVYENIQEESCNEHWPREDETAPLTQPYLELINGRAMGK